MWRNLNRVALGAGDWLAINFNNLKCAIMQMHRMTHGSLVGQHHLDALAKFDGEDISSWVFDSIDKLLISIHGSSQYRRQRAIDLFRDKRRSGAEAHFLRVVECCGGHRGCFWKRRLCSAVTC